MKLAKKLMCLSMAGLMAVAQVPVSSMAKTYRNGYDFQFWDDEITLTEVGEEVDLVEDGYFYYDGDLFAVPDLSFSSDNEDVATVTMGGMVTAVAEGKATITATAVYSEDDGTDVASSSVASSSVASSSTVDTYLATIVIVVDIDEDDTKTDDTTTDEVATGSEISDDTKTDDTKTDDTTTDDTATDDTTTDDTAEDETVLNGWYTDADGNTYYYVDGVKYVSTTVKIGDTYYEFDENGIVTSSWSASSSSSSSSSSGGGSSSSGSSSSGASSAFGTTTNSSSGATVNSNVTTGANGEKITTSTITLGGKTMTVQNTEMAYDNGAKASFYTVNGDVAGLTFEGVGTVSADGLTLVGADGVTYPICSAPRYVITLADGTTMGCFLDPATGLPIATGTDMVYMQLGADGQMHAHWVNPFGFFYTGTVVMNGMFITFDENGIMVAYA